MDTTAVASSVPAWDEFVILSHTDVRSKENFGSVIVLPV